jgi:hypothetical protein
LEFESQYCKKIYIVLKVLFLLTFSAVGVLPQAGADLYKRHDRQWMN